MIAAICSIVGILLGLTLGIKWGIRVGVRVTVDLMSVRAEVMGKTAEWEAIWPKQ